MRDDAPLSLPFMKMHGLGNDFVVVDARRDPHLQVPPGLARALADRHRGVGFDQLAIIRNDDSADIRLDFLNADGTPSAACGNATRCIARHVMDETGAAALTIATDRGLLAARDAGGGLTAVNMGPPRLTWQEIPLAEACDTLHLPFAGRSGGHQHGQPALHLLRAGCDGR